MQGENLVGSPYAYPRFSTHALSQVIKLGIKVFREARSKPAQSGRILVVTNPDDVAVNNTRTYDLVRLWKRKTPEKLHCHTLPDAWNLPHDFIDPWVPDEKMDQVYPLLIRWLSENR